MATKSVFWLPYKSSLIFGGAEDTLWLISLEMAGSPHFSESLESVIYIIYMPNVGP